MKAFILLAVSLATSIAMAEMPTSINAPELLKRNDRIIDQNDSTGRVMAVFSNGKTQVELDAYIGTHVRETENLSKGLRCFQSICEDDRIIDGSDRTGKVLEVFSNGKVRVVLDQYVGTHIRSISTLGKAFRCIENICKNDRMIDSSNNTGRILDVFNNGKVRVALDQYIGTHIRSFESLGFELKCDLRQDCAYKN